MDKQNFYTIFLSPDVFHVSKDPGMIPSILARDFGYRSFYVSYLSQTHNKQLIDSRRELNFIEIPQKNRATYQVFKKMMTPRVIWFIVKNARKIDVLNLYFLKYSIFYASLYKLLNRRGIIYIKLDFDVNTNMIIDTQRFVKLRSFVFGKYLKHVATLVSAESTDAVSYIQEKYKIDYPKLLHIPNGIDHELIDELGVKVRPFHEKENLIISVQRVGSYQKNSEVFLEALKEIDLKDWKVVIIGPIEESFNEQIEIFFADNPHLKEKVIFTGAIDDKRELYEWYNRAKIFCMTSRWEGFSLSFIEALFFGNYVVSTVVSGIYDVIDNGRSGLVINNKNELSVSLSHLISNQTVLEECYPAIIEHSKKYFWSNILSSLDREIKKQAVLKNKL